MPGTAKFVARRDNFRYSHGALYRPDLNLDLAQRYVAHLLDSKTVGGDLFNLAAAYNGGPGNLAKWRRNTAFGDDPLLFIESLPSRETRLFIERVLTNLWIYRQRLDQPAPSLAAIAAGDWPRYQSLDRPLQEVARK
jgi:soluble lytic murein transglycosylase-like protein